MLFKTAFEYTKNNIEIMYETYKIIDLITYMIQY